ncbi:hypothetical protein E2C01_048619 [Portunus trituberculatus]|uniref:Uncharacterized protein n=1 Tax=Portunus trituberculatus TaxID=210409 RepID=A0A5B7GBJ0_PORTR|nr:hypothetical protein [Portunus trituberculatus]
MGITNDQSSSISPSVLLSIHSPVL